MEWDINETLLRFTSSVFNFALMNDRIFQVSIVLNNSQIMKKRNLGLFAIYTVLSSVLLISCGSSKNSSQTDFTRTLNWQKEIPVIDGSDGDWTKPLAFTESKLGLSYTVSNDKENLYIMATSSNESTIQRILRAGLTVYINAHGVKEEAGASGISFPTGNRVQKGERMLNDRPEIQQNKRIALNAVEDYSLFGFHTIKTPENFDYGKRNPEGIELGIGINPSGELVYEALIPLASFLNKNEMTAINRKTIAVEMLIENLPDQPGSQRSGGGGISIGGGLGFGSFGSGGGLGVSIGSGSLGRIGGGGNKNGKPVKIWNEFMFAREGK